MAVEYSYDGELVHVTFSDALTPADLTDVMQFLLDLETGLASTPNRLVDLGPSTTIAIGFSDMANLVHIRQAHAPRNPIRTAVVTHSAAQHGYARMFQTLNDHPLITIAVFTDRASARAWLGVG